MATTWSLNAGEFIAQAYRRLGILPAGGVPTDDQFNQGTIAFNAMLKGWQADGINLFRQTQLQIAVNPLQGTPTNPVSITPLIMNFEMGRWVIQPSPNLYERPLANYTYIDFMNLPNKESQSSSGPSLVCFDKQVSQSLLYLWPIPTFGGTLNATVARTVNDIVEPTDPVDFPQEWTEGGIWSLADRLMADEGVAHDDPETSQDIIEHAAAFYQKLLNFDRPTSMFIRPWGKKGTGRFWR